MLAQPKVELAHYIGSWFVGSHIRKDLVGGAEILCDLPLPGSPLPELSMTRRMYWEKIWRKGMDSPMHCMLGGGGGVGGK